MVIALFPGHHILLLTVAGKRAWEYHKGCCLFSLQGSILAKQIKLFLRMLRLSKLYTYHIDDNGLKVLLFKVDFMLS